MFRTFAILLSALVLMGCTATGPEFIAAAPPPAQNGLIYIYRADGFIFSANDAHMFIDDKSVFDLSPAGYSFIYLPSGAHSIKQSWTFDIFKQSVIGFPIQVKPGEIRYFRLSTDRSQHGMMVSDNWYLAEVSAVYGRSEIQTMHLQHPNK